MYLKELHIKSAGWRIAVAAMLALLPLLLVDFLIAPRWETNDDSGADLLLRGVAVLHHRTALTYFSNVLFTWPIQQLYQIAPDYPWYYGIHVGLHYLSSVFLALACLSIRHSRGQAIFLLFYFLSIDAYFYVFPQFTVTSLLLAMVACLVWLRGPVVVFGRTNAWILTLAMLATLSALIRLECLIMAFAVTVPLKLLMTYWRMNATAVTGSFGVPPQWQHLIGPSLIALLLSIAMVGATSGINRWIYSREPGFQEFCEWNELRNRLQEYNQFPYTPETKPIYDEVGWSENDYQLLLNWIFLDPDVYSTEKLRRIAGAFGQVGLNIHPPPISQFLAFFWSSAFHRFVVLLCVAVLLVGHREWKEWGLLATATLILLAVWIGMLAYLKLPLRVLNPSFILLPALILSGTETPKANPRVLQRFWNAFAWIFCLAALSALTLVQYVLWGEHYRERDQLAQRVTWTIQELQGLKSHAIVVVGAALPLEYLPAESMQLVRGLELIWLGSASRSHLMQLRLSELEIDDLYQALYERPDIYVICAQYVAPRIAVFLREHRGVDSKVEELRVYSYPRGPVGIYRFRRAGPR